MILDSVHNFLFFLITEFLMLPIQLHFYVNGLIHKLYYLKISLGTSTWVPAEVDLYGK
jgi:hypothetical protein